MVTGRWCTVPGIEPRLLWAAGGTWLVAAIGVTGLTRGLSGSVLVQVAMLAVPIIWAVWALLSRGRTVEGAGIVFPVVTGVAWGAAIGVSALLLQGSDVVIEVLLVQAAAAGFHLATLHPKVDRRAPLGLGKPAH